MLAVGLALLASAAWGVADFIGGMKSRQISAILVLLVQQGVGVVIAGAIILATGEGIPGGEAVALSIASGVAGAIALGAFYRGLAVGTMSVVAPISASGVTLPVVFGIATGDRPGTLTAIGLAMAIVGVVLASREVHAGEAPAAARQSVLLALVAAIGFGSFFTLSDAAADESVLWLLVLGRGSAVLLLCAVVAARGGVGRIPAALMPTLLLLGVLDLAATGLFAIANTKGLLAVVAVVAALYPVTTVLLARVVLHERLQRVQAIGVVLAFLGVAAVAGGN